jgi:hypothetical protein
MQIKHASFDELPAEIKEIAKKSLAISLIFSVQPFLNTKPAVRIILSARLQTLLSSK